MSFAKMHTRKTMSFLTPQAKKTLSPARLSFGGKNGTPEKLLGGLLKDPIKRALLMEVLSQDTREDTEKPKVKTKNPQKFKFESPSALCRRRALEKMRANSDSSDNTTSPSIREQSMKEVPFDQILSGVIAYVEIKSNNMDRSAGAKALMQAMGAKIKDVLNRHVTHVVFKDGSFNTFQKAKLLKVHLVSVLWIEAVHKNRKRVPEKNYPALGAAASDADASFICKRFQQEYADVIQEELNKTQKLDTSALNAEDVVDTSQHEDIRSLISTRSVLKTKPTSFSPNSLRLETTPEITSDSEDEYYRQRKIKKKLTKKSPKSKKSSPEVQERTSPVQAANATASQGEEISSLRISTGSVDKTPARSVPKFNNVTQRKKKQGSQNNVEILSDIQISPPRQIESRSDVDRIELSNSEIKQLDNNLKQLERNKQRTTADSVSNVQISPLRQIDAGSDADRTELSNSEIKQLNNNLKRLNNSSVTNQHVVEIVTKPPKKTARRLYNFDDFIDSVENSINGNDTDSPRSVKTDLNARTSRNNAKTTPHTVPRRKSTRFLHNGNSSDHQQSLEVAEVSRDAPKKKNNGDLAKETQNSSDDFDETPDFLNTSKTRSTEEANDSISPSKRPRIEPPKQDFKKPQSISAKKDTKVLKTPTRRSTRLLSRDSTQEVNEARPRRSSLDFVKEESVQKTPKIKSLTQRSKSPKRTSIVCTRFHATEVQVFQQIVKKLGVFFVEDEVTEKTTHLVAAESRRTVNLLRAIARGCWVVKSEWLYRSLEEDNWLPEEDHELRDFSPAVQKARLERQAFGPRYSMDIFKDCGKIFIYRGSNPRCSDLQELVTLCKGTVTTTLRTADIVVGQYVDDKPSVTVNWILDSITYYKRKSLRKYVIEPPSSDQNDVSN